jgi:hypothetical protein
MPLDSIVQNVTGLEQLCSELEVALRSRDWPRMDCAIADARRTMHELENAMADATSVRTADFDREIFARLQRVYAVRDEQMKRLASIHEEVAENLRALSRWKGYARSIGGRDQRRPSRILNDLR